MLVLAGIVAALAAGAPASEPPRAACVPPAEVADEAGPGVPAAPATDGDGPEGDADRDDADPPPAPAPEPAPAEEIAAQARAILADRVYQQDLPDAPQPPSKIDLPWLGLLLKGAAYAGAALLAIVAVLALARRLRRSTPDVEVAEPEPALDAPVPIPTDGAEALAAAGRYADAIHALLLDTLAALSRAARLAPSLTSREILGRVRIAPRARDALAGLVLAVELSRFGGAVPGEAEYLACLDRFHAFLDGYRRAA